jgi:molybdate transport system ATP-binding protein
MVIQVAVEKSMESKARHFKLNAAFTSQEQCVVLFGPSGSGKTLTLQSIAGLISPDAGKIALNGRVLFDSQNGVNVPSRHRKIGYLFQDYALFPHLTVLENVGFGLNQNWQWRLSSEDRHQVMEFRSFSKSLSWLTAFPPTFREARSSAWHWREL